MLSFFNRKSEKEILGEKYRKCLKEAYVLSTVNRAESDKKTAEAHRILEQIEKLP